MRRIETPLYNAWQNAKSQLNSLQIELEKTLLANDTTLDPQNARLLDLLDNVKAAALEEKGLLEMVNTIFLAKLAAEEEVREASNSTSPDETLVAQKKLVVDEKKAALEQETLKLRDVQDKLAEHQRTLLQTLLKENAAKRELQAAAVLREEAAARQPVPPPPGSPVVVAAADAAPVVHAPVTKAPALLDKIWAEYTKFCKNDEGLTKEGERISADRIEESLRSRDSAQPLLAFDGAEQACRFFTNIAKSAPDKSFFSEEIGEDGKPTGEYIVYDGKGDAKTATAVHGKLSQATIQRCIEHSAAIGTSGKTQELHEVLMNRGKLSSTDLDNQVNRLIDAAVPSPAASANMEATKRLKISRDDLVGNATPAPTGPVGAINSGGAPLQPPADASRPAAGDSSIRPKGLQ